jgi:hypothetical protein
VVRRIHTQWLACRRCQKNAPRFARFWAQHAGRSGPEAESEGGGPEAGVKPRKLGALGFKNITVGKKKQRGETAADTFGVCSGVGGLATAR